MNNKLAVVVLPTFNEAKNIVKIIDAIFLQQSKISTHKLHILVVDSDSPDGTKRVVELEQKKHDNLHVITFKKRGLGLAYIAGFKHAIHTFSNLDLLLQMDSDGQHDANMIPVFINILNYNLDCVIGSRFVSGGELVNFSLKRRLISKVGNALIRIIGGIQNISDCTSGFRCIRASFINNCQFNNLIY